MKLGIQLDLRNPAPWRRSVGAVYGEALDLCVAAEQAGLDSIWLSEHHLFEDGYLPQPLTFAAAVAARTRRVRIGTAVLLAPLRTPVQIAEEVAVVDALSNGRVDLGLGAGYLLEEFTLYGRDPATRRAATDRTVRELRRIWAGGTVTPAPVQPRVPIWLGYTGPLGARRAGRLGEGLLAVDPVRLPDYRAGLAEGGHDPASARTAGVVSAYVTEDPDRDWPRLRPHHAYMYASYRDAAARGTANTARGFGQDPDRVDDIGGALGTVVVDTPEAVAAAVRAHVGDGPVDTVYVWAAPGGLPRDMAEQHVAALGRLATLLR